MIALHPWRPTMGDSARDVLPHPRYAASENRCALRRHPLSPHGLFRASRGGTLECRASIMPVLSNDLLRIMTAFCAPRNRRGCGARKFLLRFPKASCPEGVLPWVMQGSAWSVRVGIPIWILVDQRHHFLAGAYSHFGVDVLAVGFDRSLGNAELLAYIFERGTAQ